MSGTPSDSYDEFAGNYLNSAGSAYFFEDPTMGISQNEQMTELGIMPNPGSGLYQINVMEPSEIQVYGACGNLVVSKENESGNVVLNLTEMESGMYFVVVTNDQRIWCGRLINMK
jgi:hypothetical protein